MRLRRIESDAEHRCRNNCCRRNHSPLASIRKSGLEIKNRCMKEGVNGENLASIRKSGPEIKNRCTKEGVNGKKLASIRKSGPEIKNHCSQKDKAWAIPAAILKLTPSNQESLHAGGCKQAKPCSDSQVYPLKSRIDARSSPSPAHHPAHPSAHPPAHPPARVPSRVDDASCLGCFTWGRAQRRFDSGGESGC